jgi:CRP-like cAMP-binding protein
MPRPLDALLGRSSLPLLLPGASLLARCGSLVPAAVVKLAAVLGFAALAVGLASGLRSGEPRLVLDPFADLGPAWPGLLRLYLAAAGLLTVQGLARGLVLGSAGLAVPGLVVQVFLGFVHIGTDDRERRAAGKGQRALLSWSSLAVLAAGAGAGMLALAAGQGLAGWSSALAAAGTYLLLADLAPWLRGEGRNLLGLHVRIPRLRQRAATYLRRRVSRNLLRREPLGKAERAYILVACLWIGHTTLALVGLGNFLVPGALALLQATASRPDAGLLATLACLFVVLVLGLALCGLGLMVVALVLSAIWQIVAAPRRTRPTSSGAALDEGTGFVVEELERIPFMAALGRESLQGIARVMQVERYAAGAVIVQQGEPGDHFYFIRQGQASVLIEEESGLCHPVASLSAGDSFGEVALVREVPRTATVKAIGPVEVLSLGREAFLEAVERSGTERDRIIDQVRNAAFLRTVPVFQNLRADLCRVLLEGSCVQRFAPGDKVIEQGAVADALYVIREGRCKVLVAAEGGEREVAQLAAGEWFGEIGLLRGIARTATVAATEPVVAIRVPAEVFAHVLIDDFRAALDLEDLAAERLAALQGA